VTGRRLMLAAAFWYITSSATAGPYDPTLTFKSIVTTHFIVHFHQGEERLASRLAHIAERVHDAVVRARSHAPTRRTHIILADQNDNANGSATVVPWNAIRIDATPPTGLEEIGNTDNWLEYVFTHEYAHICHLDRSRGWARAAKAIFGRTVLAFPNLSLPLWQIEGLATFVESEEGAGRLHSGDFKEVVAAGIRANRFEPIDRVNGGLVAWPNGDGWYAYGALFHEFLVERYGRDRLETLAGRTAGRLPYFTSGAFRDVYGKSLGNLWHEFNAWSKAQSAPDPGDSATRLTWLGFSVRTPRVGADGSVWFSASGPHGFPGLYRLPPDNAAPERIASRFGGSGLSVRADVAVFDQLEIVRGAGLRSDLYVVGLGGGSVRRLTRQARLVDPDVSSDGRLLVAVQVQSGSRRLVVLNAQSLLTSQKPVAARSLRFIASLGDEADVFAAPRFSPDGRRIAVERRRRGGPSEIVIVDAALQGARVVAISPTGRNVTPDWSADGTAVIFASDRDGGPFALYETSSLDWMREPRRVVRVAGGARSPALAPDGRVVFVGYTAAGFDLFEGRIAMRGDTGGATPSGGLDTDGATPTGRIAMRADTDGATPSGRIAMHPYENYRPWPTLLPHGWLPLIDRRDGRWRLGAVVAGYDVLGRHVIAADATWAVNDGDVGGGLAPRSRPDWSASYIYQRWQTAPFVSVRDRTSLFNAVTTEGSVVPVAQREQQVDAGIYRAFRRIRWTQAVTGMFHAERESTVAPALEQEIDRSGLRTSWTLFTARQYGYSISPEDGIGIGVTGEFFRPAFGSDGRADAFTADGRAYVSLPRQGVVALRLAGAASSGDPGMRRAFRLGGSDGNAALGVFGSDAISLLRGFEDDVVSGTRVMLMNAELRVPVVWPQRGVGTWPIFLRSVHATLFTDIGHAWTNSVRWADRKTGVGAELSADVTAGFGVPLTWTVGAAWGHDGAGVLPDGREIYVRLGRAF
jgi:Omp85 superfamily domain/WD40-like Beta Propeller Repeat